MRREALKQYLIALLSENEFSGLSTVEAVVKKAMAMLALDLPIAAAELIQMMEASKGNHFTAKVVGLGAELLVDVQKRGFKNLWDNIMGQHARGTKNLRKHRR